MIGAAPYMIRQDENGCLYRDGNKKELFETAEALLKDPQRRRRLGENAYETIRSVWNAENAASRLCGLIESLTGIVVDEGMERGSEEAGKVKGFAPCDVAPVISERRMYRYLTEKK